MAVVYVQSNQRTHLLRLNSLVVVAVVIRQSTSLTVYVKDLALGLLRCTSVEYTSNVEIYGLIRDGVSYRTTPNRSTELRILSAVAGRDGRSSMLTL